MKTLYEYIMNMVESEEQPLAHLGHILAEIDNTPLCKWDKQDLWTTTVNSEESPGIIEQDRG